MGMNYQKIHYLSKRKSIIHHLATNPTEIFKIYAQQSSINEWLKVYYVNPECAIWMFQWTPYYLPLEPNHIPLNTYKENDDDDNKYLIYFLNNHSLLAKLTISDDFLNYKIIRAIQNIKQLSFLKIQFSRHSNFSLTSLTTLKTLEIASRRGVEIFHFRNILSFTNLTSLSISECTITNEITQTLADLKLRHLHLVEARNPPQDIVSPMNDRYWRITPSVHIPYNLFHDKKQIELESCELKLVENLCRNCKYGQEKLKIVTGSFIVGTALVVLGQTAPASTLQSIEIHIKIDYSSKYTDFLTLLRIIPKCLNLQWKVYITIEQTNTYRYLSFESYQAFVTDIISRANEANENYEKVNIEIKFDRNYRPRNLSLQ